MSRFSAQEFYLQILLPLLTPASFFRQSRQKFCWWLWNWPRFSCGWQSRWAVYSGSDVSLVVQQGRRRPSPGKRDGGFWVQSSRKTYFPQKCHFFTSGNIFLLKMFVHGCQNSFSSPTGLLCLQACFCLKKTQQLHLGKWFGRRSWESHPHTCLGTQRCG